MNNVLLRCIGVIARCLLPPVLVGSATFPASTAASPPDGPWSGSVQSVLDVHRPSYRRQETHTWTLTGDPPTLNGDVRLYNALWSVTGKGAFQQSQGAELISVDWTIDVPPTPVTLAIFMRASDQRLIIRQWSPFKKIPGAIRGTRQVTVSGQAGPAVPITGTAVEWFFMWIDDDRDQTTVVGTKNTNAEYLPGHFHLSGQPTNASSTWHFTKSGTAAPPPDRPGPGTLGGALPAPDGRPETAGTVDGRPVSGQALEQLTPRDPENFTARQVGDGEVELSWNAVSGVSRYAIVGPGADSGVKVEGTSTRLKNVPAGQQTWLLTSWYEPDGSRTRAEQWSRATATIVPMKGIYRVSVTRVVVHHEEPDDPFKLHGKNNEIFITSKLTRIDRRQWTMIGGTSFTRTPVLGDTANSGPNGGTRVRAGTVAQSGGIQSGDDIPLRHSVWLGELRDGIDVLVFRPVVWVFFGDDREFYRPYAGKPFDQTTVQPVETAVAGIIDNVARSAYYLSQFSQNAPVPAPDTPELRAAVARGGLSVDPVPAMQLTGRWSNRCERPMGMTVRVADANDPDTFAAVWTDRAIVITREKAEQALAGGPAAATASMHVNGGMTGAKVMPLGSYTLTVTVERAEKPAGRSHTDHDLWYRSVMENLRELDSERN